MTNNVKHKYSRLQKRIQRYVDTSLNKLMKRTDSKWHEYIVKMSFIPLTVTINDRYHNTLGAAWADLNGFGKPKALYIDFSVELFENKHTITFIREVVTHELAHCLDYMIRGKTCHDQFWKDLHQEEFNGTGSRLVKERNIDL